MEIYIQKKIKNPTIIEGFPGLGFVATIAVEYLIEHLGAKSFGRMWSPDIPPMAAFHKSRIHRPVEIFYDPKHNILFVHALSAPTGYEWEIADAILVLAQQLKAKEIISLEGVASPFGTPLKTSSFYYTTSDKFEKRIQKLNIKKLNEGVIVGVAGALMLKAVRGIPATFFLTETTSKMPDSNAAAELVKILDGYLGLKVDPKPLAKQAALVEEKIRDIVKKGEDTMDLKKKKELSYVG